MRTRTLSAVWLLLAVVATSGRAQTAGSHISATAQVGGTSRSGTDMEGIVEVELADELLGKDRAYAHAVATRSYSLITETLAQQYAFQLPDRTIAANSEIEQVFRARGPLSGEEQYFDFQFMLRATLDATSTDAPQGVSHGLLDFSISTYDGTHTKLDYGMLTVRSLHGKPMNSPPPTGVFIRPNSCAPVEGDANSFSVSCEIHHQVKVTSESTTLKVFLKSDVYAGGSLSTAAHIQSTLTLEQINGHDELSVEFGNGYKVQTGAILGDYNNDGSVDTADYVLIQPTYFKDEYRVWRANYGKKKDGTQSNLKALVPEPTTYVLTAACFIILLASRRSRYR